MHIALLSSPSSLLERFKLAFGSLLRPQEHVLGSILGSFWEAERALGIFSFLKDVLNEISNFDPLGGVPAHPKSGPRVGRRHLRVRVL